MMNGYLSGYGWAIGSGTITKVQLEDYKIYLKSTFENQATESPAQKETRQVYTGVLLGLKEGLLVQDTMEALGVKIPKSKP